MSGTLGKATIGLLAVLLAIVCADFMIKAADLQGKNYVEGAILAMVDRLRYESPSRAWIDRLPYTLTNYGPGFYWISKAAGDLTRQPVSLLPLRYIAIVAALASAVVIAGVVTRRTREPALGGFAALIFLVAPVVEGWVPLARVDTLEVLLGLGAYAALDTVTPKPVLSAAFVAAASLVKPTGALAAVPLAVYLILTRRTRDAVLFGAAVALLGGITWSVVFWQSQGFYFWGVFKANTPAFSLWRGYQQTYAFLASPVTVVAMVSLAWAVVGRPAVVLDSPYPVGFVTSLAFSALMVCREGSTFNYFIAPAALGSVTIGLYGLPALLALHRPRAYTAIGLAAGLITLPAIQDLRARMPLSAVSGYERVERVVTRTAQRGDLVLADGRWMDAVLRIGLRPAINDPYLFRTVVDSRRMTTTSLVEALRKGDIHFAVLSTSLEGYRHPAPVFGAMWPSEILDAISAYYVEVLSEPGLCVYEYAG